MILPEKPVPTLGSSPRACFSGSCTSLCWRQRRCVTGLALYAKAPGRCGSLNRFWGSLMSEQIASEPPSRTGVWTGFASSLALLAMTGRCAQRSCFDRFARRAKTCQSLAAKIFLFIRILNYRITIRPTRHEGRSYVVTNAGWDAVDAAASGARGCCGADIKSVSNDLRADERR